MVFSLALFFVWLSIALHELGHAFAMRECKVRVKEICLLGLPLGKKFGIKIPNLMPRFFPDTTWVLHPLIIGAYVEQEKEDMKNLSYMDKTYIYGNGVLLNIQYALWLGFIILFALGGMQPLTIGYGLGLVLMSGTLYVLRKHICGFLFPILSVLMFGLIIYSIVQNGIVTETGGFEMTFAVIDDLTYSNDPSIPLIVKILYPGLVISIALGLVNLAAVMPLDGGHIAHEVLGKVTHRYVIHGLTFCGVIAIMGLSAYILFYDVVWIGASVIDIFK